MRDISVDITDEKKPQPEGCGFLVF